MEGQTVTTDDILVMKDEVKVLGIIWNHNSDMLIFDLSSLFAVANELQPTKRNVVSLIGRFYDPLGFLAPITIRFKILPLPVQA